MFNKNVHCSLNGLLLYIWTLVCDYFTLQVPHGSKYKLSKKCFYFANLNVKPIQEVRLSLSLCTLIFVESNIHVGGGGNGLMKVTRCLLRKIWSYKSGKYAPSTM